MDVYEHVDTILVYLVVLCVHACIHCLSESKQALGCHLTLTLEVCDNIFLGNTDTLSVTIPFRCSLDSILAPPTRLGLA